MASKTEEKDTSSDLPEGWALVHSQEETTEQIAGQGVYQVIPALYRAEKQLNGTLVNAQGETMESLAAAAEAVEQSVSALKTDPVGAPATPTPTFVSETITEGETDTSPEEVEVNTETVITPDGTYTEEEWSGRSKTDTIVTEDGQTIYAGVGEQTDEIDQALEQTAAEAAEAANEAVAEEPVETEQIVYDTADKVDSPGQSAGGTLIVPAGVETLEDAAAKQNEASQAAENERVVPTEEAAEDTEAPPATEGAIEASEELGVDLNDVEGTGKDGKITKADVEAHADGD